MHNKNPYKALLKRVDVKVGLAPLRLAPFACGIGMKTMAVESMGVGVPVVSNSIGTENMTCKLGADLLIDQSSQERTDCRNALLGSPEKRTGVLHAGGECVGCRPDWRASIENPCSCLEFAAAYRVGGDV